MEQLRPNLCILAAAARRDVERVVGILKELKCGAITEAFAEWFQQFKSREFVPSPLEEEHRDLDIEQMLSAFVGRLVRRMKREAKEYQAPNSR